MLALVIAENAWQGLAALALLFAVLVVGLWREQR
jgi:hypothetical protein